MGARLMIARHWELGEGMREAGKGHRKALCDCGSMHTQPRLHTHAACTCVYETSEIWGALRTLSDHPPVFLACRTCGRCSHRGKEAKEAKSPFFFCNFLRIYIDFKIKKIIMTGSLGVMSLIIDSRETKGGIQETKPLFLAPW